ncbi:putative CmcJ-like methyltransferase [Elsinoe ampelina]|uniref:Putative CmcJ-like methyltransferase n=1 Tax=Elsinoe ampelina TaxID=302913 RepID=A0A6A6GRC7_9PEZI|nr:putative CmcJ-like methyltransferase [Elsinoe ampelina]
MPIFTLIYLARDALWKQEKPFYIESDPVEGLNGPRTNYILEQHDVEIMPIRPSDSFDLDVHGFSVLKENTELDLPTALSDPEQIEEAYTDQVAAILRRRFPQYRRLERIDFVVRKRDERFPREEEDRVEGTLQQPAGVMHTDYSVEGATSHLHYTFPGNEEYFKGRDYDMLNVWRPLVGPNDDWPLAVCDYTSIDRQRDVIQADILYNVRIGENQILHHDPGHRYYYIPSQEPDDMFVFRNVDSSGKRPISFHGSFHNPQGKGPPRQSCEVRFVAFR